MKTKMDGSLTHIVGMLEHYADNMSQLSIGNYTQVKTTWVTWKRRK